MRKRAHGAGRGMGSYTDGQSSVGSRVKTLPPAACPTCGARLSAYRLPLETVCAPCRQAAQRA